MFRRGEPIVGYTLERRLGKGNYGEVWRATAGGAAVALKFISMQDKAGFREWSGIRQVKNIRHRNLMPVTGIWMLDEDGNQISDKMLDRYEQGDQSILAKMGRRDSTRPSLLIVAMLLADANLRQRAEDLEGNRIPSKELLAYMVETAEGIDFLNAKQHDLGEGPQAIQHLDIKPENIVLWGGQVMICDFGLAHTIGDLDITMTSTPGTLAYISPECLRKRPSRRSDQYSLACSYYVLRSGHLPFPEDASQVHVIESHLRGKLDFSRLPERERKVINRAVSPQPADRYETCKELVTALQEAITPRTKPSPKPPPQDESSVRERPSETSPQRKQRQESSEPEPTEPTPAKKEQRAAAPKPPQSAPESAAEKRTQQHPKPRPAQDPTPNKEPPSAPLPPPAPVPASPEAQTPAKPSKPPPPAAKPAAPIRETQRESPPNADTPAKPREVARGDSSPSTAERQEVLRRTMKEPPRKEPVEPPPPKADPPKVTDTVDRKPESKSDEGTKPLDDDTIRTLDPEVVAKASEPPPPITETPSDLGGTLCITTPLPEFDEPPPATEDQLTDQQEPPAAVQEEPPVIETAPLAVPEDRPVDQRDVAPEPTDERVEANIASLDETEEAPTVDHEPTPETEDTTEDDQKADPVTRDEAPIGEEQPPPEPDETSQNEIGVAPADAEEEASVELELTREEEAGARVEAPTGEDDLIDDEESDAQDSACFETIRPDQPVEATEEEFDEAPAPYDDEPVAKPDHQQPSSLWKYAAWPIGIVAVLGIAIAAWRYWPSPDPVGGGPTEQFESLLGDYKYRDALGLIAQFDAKVQDARTTQILKQWGEEAATRMPESTFCDLLPEVGEVLSQARSPAREDIYIKGVLAWYDRTSGSTSYQRADRFHLLAKLQDSIDPIAAEDLAKEKASELDALATQGWQSAQDSDWDNSRGIFTEVVSWTDADRGSDAPWRWQGRLGQALADYATAKSPQLPPDPPSEVEPSLRNLYRGLSLLSQAPPSNEKDLIERLLPAVHDLHDNEPFQQDIAKFALVQQSWRSLNDEVVKAGVTQVAKLTPGQLEQLNTISGGLLSLYGKIADVEKQLARETIDYDQVGKTLLQIDRDCERVTASGRDDLVTRLRHQIFALQVRCGIKNPQNSAADFLEPLTQKDWNRCNDSIHQIGQDILKRLDNELAGTADSNPPLIDSQHVSRVANVASDLPKFRFAQALLATDIDFNVTAHQFARVMPDMSTGRAVDAFITLGRIECGLMTSSNEMGRDLNLARERIQATERFAGYIEYLQFLAVSKKGQQDEKAIGYIKPTVEMVRDRQGVFRTRQRRTEIGDALQRATHFDEFAKFFQDPFGGNAESAHTYVTMSQQLAAGESESKLNTQLALAAFFSGDDDDEKLGEAIRLSQGLIDQGFGEPNVLWVNATAHKKLYERDATNRTGDWKAATQGFANLINEMGAPRSRRLRVSDREYYDEVLLPAFQLVSGGMDPNQFIRVGSGNANTAGQNAAIGRIHAEVAELIATSGDVNLIDRFPSPLKAAQTLMEFAAKVDAKDNYYRLRVAELMRQRQDIPWTTQVERAKQVAVEILRDNADHSRANGLLGWALFMEAARLRDALAKRDLLRRAIQHSNKLVGYSERSDARDFNLVTLSNAHMLLALTFHEEDPTELHNNLEIALDRVTQASQEATAPMILLQAAIQKGNVYEDIAQFDRRSEYWKKAAEANETALQEARKWETLEAMALLNSARCRYKRIKYDPAGPRSFDDSTAEIDAALGQLGTAEDLPQHDEALATNLMLQGSMLRTKAELLAKKAVGLGPAERQSVQASIKSVIQEMEKKNHQAVELFTSKQPFWAHCQLNYAVNSPQNELTIERAEKLLQVAESDVTVAAPEEIALAVNLVLLKAAQHGMDDRARITERGLAILKSRIDSLRAADGTRPTDVASETGQTVDHVVPSVVKLFEVLARLKLRDADSSQQYYSQNFAKHMDEAEKYAQDINGEMRNEVLARVHAMRGFGHTVFAMKRADTGATADFQKAKPLYEKAKISYDTAIRLFPQKTKEGLQWRIGISAIAGKLWRGTKERNFIDDIRHFLKGVTPEDFDLIEEEKTRRSLKESLKNLRRLEEQALPVATPAPAPAG